MIRGCVTTKMAERRYGVYVGVGLWVIGVEVLRGSKPKPQARAMREWEWGVGGTAARPGTAGPKADKT